MEISVFLHVLIWQEFLNSFLLKITLSPLFDILKHFLFTYATEGVWEKGAKHQLGTKKVTGPQPGCCKR